VPSYEKHSKLSQFANVKAKVQTGLGAGAGAGAVHIIDRDKPIARQILAVSNEEMNKNSQAGVFAPDHGESSGP
jgi:hypothetical protein